MSIGPPAQRWFTLTGRKVKIYGGGAELHIAWSQPLVATTLLSLQVLWMSECTLVLYSMMSKTIDLPISVDLTRCSDLKQLHLTRVPLLVQGKGHSQQFVPDLSGGSCQSARHLVTPFIEGRVAEHLATSDEILVPITICSLSFRK